MTGARADRPRAEARREREGTAPPRATLRSVAPDGARRRAWEHAGMEARWTKHGTRHRRVTRTARCRTSPRGYTLWLRNGGERAGCITPLGAGMRIVEAAEYAASGAAWVAIAYARSGGATSPTPESRRTSAAGAHPTSTSGHIWHELTRCGGGVPAMGGVLTRDDSSPPQPLGENVLAVDAPDVPPLSKESMLDRVRAVRMDVRHVRMCIQLVHLHSASQGILLVHSYGLLLHHALRAIHSPHWAQALREHEQAATIRVALASRALLLLPTLPSGLPCSAAQPLLRDQVKALNRAWDCFGRALRRRVAVPARGQSVRSEIAAVAHRMRTTDGRRRPSTLGRLTPPPSSFPPTLRARDGDYMRLPFVPAARTRIRRAPLSECGATDAGASMLEAALRQPRSQKYIPKPGVQRLLYDRVRRWRLDEALEGPTDDAVFLVEQVAQALVNADLPPEGPVPVAIARRVLRRDALSTPLASTSGHWWRVRELGPACPRFLATIMGYAAMPAARAMEAVITPTQVRSAWGIAVHGAVATWLFKASRRHFQRAAGEPAPTTYALVGAGAALWATAFQACHPEATWKYYYEPDDLAAAACEATASALGQRPARRGWAHDALPPSDWAHVDEMLISISCAPYSRRNTSFPSDVPRALAELAGVARLVERAAPKVAYIEQTGSLALPSRRAARKAFEAILTGCGNYEWVVTLVCPRRHLGLPVMRPRLLYTGVRRT